MDGQHAAAGEADALVASRRLELAQAREQFDRRQPLLTEKAVSAEELAQASTQVRVAEAALAAAEQHARAAHALIDGIGVADNPAVLQARAAYEEAWLAVRRSSVRAPIAGYVARRTVQVGQRVLPGAALLVIVPLDKLWVDANFKESQLASLRIGQPVTVVADVYGRSATFHGRVAGLSAGTGSAFSLLPAQNASGNWIKVVQRLAVRIELDAQELAAHPLRIGLSTSVAVDTHDRSGPMLAATAHVAAQTGIYEADAAAAEAAAAAIVAGGSPPAP